MKVTMKVKPYDKKMVTTTSTYGTENANYTGGRIEHFHIERGKTEKLNKDGSFKGWDPYDEYDEYNADQTEYYEFYGDNYTLQDIFPEQLLINDEKNQRLENADIEISLTKKALTEIENFRKGSTKQITTGIKTIIVVSIIEVIGTILLCILFALQEKRTRFFRGLDRLWWEIILVTATTLLGLAIALCFAIWEYTIEYTQGGITGSTIEMIMTLSYISVPFLSWHLPYVFRLRYGGFARRIFSIQHFVWDIFENGAVRQRQEESWKMKRCHLHKNMQETGSDSTGSYDIF